MAGDVGAGSGVEPVDVKKKRARPGRSPSVYYSPSGNRKQKIDADTKSKDKPATAAKSAAKSAAKAAAEKPKTGNPVPSEPTKKKIKHETSTPPVCPDAVQAALNRANTVEMAEKPAAQDGADDASSEASGESGKSSEESQQDGGLEPGTQPAATGGPTLEQVRKKREAHARFMRFSRSLKSYLVANKSAKLMLNTVLVLLVCTSYSRLFVLTLAVLNSIHTFALFSWRGVNWIYWMFVATT